MNTNKHVNELDAELALASAKDEVETFINGSDIDRLESYLAAQETLKKEYIQLILTDNVNNIASDLNMEDIEHLQNYVNSENTGETTMNAKNKVTDIFNNVKNACSSEKTEKAEKQEKADNKKESFKSSYGTWKNEHPKTVLGLKIAGSVAIAAATAAIGVIVFKRLNVAVVTEAAATVGEVIAEATTTVV